ncbi:hypothetical protein P7M58_06885 [Vibrio parahaemolyticus]|nr:hypothetical protein [Vibrio parahaemolyticus]
MMATLSLLSHGGLRAVDHRQGPAAQPFKISLSDAAYQAKKQFVGLEMAVDRAIVRATRKTARWLAVHSARELKVALKLKNTKRLKDRIKIFVSGSGSSTTIFFGLAPIEVEAAGKPRNNADGVSVGGRQYDGAFYRVVYGSMPYVWIRTKRNEREHHPIYRSSKQHSNLSVKAADLAGRFPVQRIGLEIEEPATDVIERLEARTNERFLVVFDQELNYELTKLGQKA